MEQPLFEVHDLAVEITRALVASLAVAPLDALQMPCEVSVAQATVVRLDRRHEVFRSGEVVRVGLLSRIALRSRDVGGAAVEHGQQARVHRCAGAVHVGRCLQQPELLRLWRR